MRFHWSRVRFRRRYLVIPILLIVLGVVIAVHSGSLNQPTAQRGQRAASPPSPHCGTGQPLAGVSNPLRFRVLSNCEVASGVVESVSVQDGGDQRIYVRLDAQFGKLLVEGNSNHQNSLLVLELFSEYQAIIQVPSVGQHITFVGPWVYDTENLWNAICPVRSITTS
jgi:hypothetical protein